MGDAFEIVTLSVSEVIHRISIPLVACTEVGDIQHTVDQRVTEQHVRMSHIDLGTKYEGTRLTLTAVHKLKQLQVLLHRTITIGTVRTRTGGRSLLLGNHLGTLLVHISSSMFDEPDGKVPEFLEVVAGIVDIGPLETQPLDVVFDALDVFCILLLGVGVVKAQITLATVFLGQSEVYGDSLGMTDMQVAVGLRRETGLNPTGILACCQVVFDHLLNKTDRLSFFVLVQYFLFHYLLILNCYLLILNSKFT